MDDVDLGQMQQAITQLDGNLSEQVFVHPTEARLLDVLVQVDVEQLKDNDEVSAEVKAVIHTDDSILVGVLAQDTIKQFGLYACIVRLLLFIFAYFNRNTAPTLFHVDAADD